MVDNQRLSMFARPSRMFGVSQALVAAGWLRGAPAALRRCRTGWRHTIRRTSMGGQAAREIADVYGSTCVAAGCGSVVMLGRGTG